MKKLKNNTSVFNKTKFYTLGKEDKNKTVYREFMLSVITKDALAELIILAA